MDSRITGGWWALGLRGLAAIVLGIACFFLTGMALAVLVALFAAYLFVSGIVAGGLAIFFPAITALVLAFIIAGWALVTGVLEIAAAVSLRRVIQNEWVLGLSGVLSIVFAVLVAIFPGAGLVAMIWLIGAYAIVWGALLIGLAARLHSHQGRMVAAA